MGLAITTASWSTRPIAAAVPPARSAPDRCARMGGERQLRVGVVGLGKQARDDHLPAVRASEMAELVAVCDTDGERLTNTRHDLGVAGYRTVNEMLAGEHLDLVVVAVPHHAGREVIAAAAECGVHVLKEKPFATNLAEARDLAALCARSGIELMVTMQRRFNPIYSTFHQLYDQIGRPFLVDAAYTLAVNPAEGWRGQLRLAGGGCIIDMGYHMIDMLIWYFGLPDRVLVSVST
jgi:predicted dehydrogenase